MSDDEDLRLGALERRPLALVIEDDPDTITYLKHGLARLSPDMDLHFYDSLADALAATVRRAPDVVVVDLSLPDASGAVAPQSVANLLGRNALVVFTNHDQPSLMAELERHAFTVVHKHAPEALRLLSEALHEKLEIRSAPADPAELADRLAEMAHALATPATVVQVISEMIREMLSRLEGQTDVGQALATNLDLLERQAYRLSGTIADLRRLSDGLANPSHTDA